jgi:hypothetical protein
MEAFVDNIWSTPSTLHFRICVVTNPRYRMWKREVHIAIDDLIGVDVNHLRDALTDEVDPTRDPAQGTLFAVPSAD